MLVAGSVVYAVGSLLLTMGPHVPMNETLATLPADAGSTAYWQEYRERWTRWNHVRAAASLTAAVLFAAGLGARC